ncbi:MAG TPA: PEGA domain-containing protein, partial [Tepidisphaeraceae bacterium]|nr:PEGA domain-containing protein [Tepidisphaeraceae bacterium]
MHHANHNAIRIIFALVSMLTLASCGSPRQPTTQWISTDRLALPDRTSPNIMMIRGCLLDSSRFTTLAREFGARDREETRALAQIVAEQLHQEGVLTMMVDPYNTRWPDRVILRDDDFDRAIELAWLQGHLAITTQPDGALIKIDGRDAGQSDLRLWMPARRYSLSISKDGF